MGQEWTAPISSQLRSLYDRLRDRLRRERPGLGTALLFPTPVEPDKPVTYERVRCWLTRAEQRGPAEATGWLISSVPTRLGDCAEASAAQGRRRSRLRVVTGGMELRELQA